VSLLPNYSGFLRSYLNRRPFQLLIVGPVACLALSSCAVGPDYHAPEPPLPRRFVASASNSNLVVAPDRPAEANQWWRSLHDRELDSLVDRAIAANPTLEIALERL
jgi:outer membrane protein TolC